MEIVSSRAGSPCLRLKSSPEVDSLLIHVQCLDFFDFPPVRQQEFVFHQSFLQFVSIFFFSDVFQCTASCQCSLCSPCRPATWILSLPASGFAWLTCSTSMGITATGRLTVCLYQTGVLIFALRSCIVFERPFRTAGFFCQKHCTFRIATLHNRQRESERERERARERESERQRDRETVGRWPACL